MYRQDPDLRRYVDAVVKTWPDLFEHLEEARVLYLLTTDDLKIKGQRKSGMALQPTAMGQNRKLYLWAISALFEADPDAIVLIQEEDWGELTDTQRLALVFHELRHIVHKHSRDGEPLYDQEGNPTLEIVGHDIEEFHGVVEEFGAWHAGLEEFREKLGSDPSEKVREALERLKT